jgi:three-Cys-motif partner protein
MCALIDEVGPWSEVKVEIVREYAQVFLKIIAGSRASFHPVYMDGFSGSGLLKSETRGATVESTPTRIVAIEPGFEEYWFIEKDPAKRDLLEGLIGNNPKVSAVEGDSNEILLEELLPKMTYGSFRKGLLFLDPYKLAVDWRVVEAAGKSRCVDLLLNFPIHDMNRAVLWTDPSRVSASNIARMNWFCGAESWREVAYREERDLFGNVITEKVGGNEPIVEWYRQRLKDVAGFEHVSTALPMKNENNVVVYYLIGASQKPQAVSVFNSVFKKWRKRGVRVVGAEFDRVD